MKLKRKLLSYLISILIGKRCDYIIISIEDKEIDNFILRKPYKLDVSYFNIPSFAHKQIIIDLSKQFDENELMLDRFTYEAENNINC